MLVEVCAQPRAIPKCLVFKIPTAHNYNCFYMQQVNISLYHENNDKVAKCLANNR